MPFTKRELNFPPTSFKKREEETFEDYTTVTPWEKFTHSLENILRRWELKVDGDPNIRQLLVSLSTCSLSGYICGRLNFGDREFQLVYHRGIESTVSDVPQTNNDPFELVNIFPKAKHIFPGHFVPPVAWFGLGPVLILRPTEGTFRGATRLHMLLSSVEIAMHSVHCPLPILIEYAGPYSSYFYGLATTASLFPDNPKIPQSVSGGLADTLNVDFAIGQLHGNVNPLCTHLAGLREVFLERLCYQTVAGCPTPPDVQISARLIYPLPYWPELTDFQVSAVPCFSFDMTSLSSPYPLFHLSAVWPHVPTHAITRKPSWTTLRPEGAPEWYLQVFLQTSHADRLSSRLKLFRRTCRDSDADDPRPSLTPHSTALPSRLAWLGADLPRLTQLFQNRSTPFVPSEHLLSSSTDKTSTQLELTGELVIHYLLFLFPDADANLSCADTLSNELQQPLNNVSTQCDLLNWSRTQNRTSPQISSLATRLGLPPITSLTHRLAVLLCNLHFAHQTAATSNSVDPVQIMYGELCEELRLRLDRLIGLPPSRVYRESELAVTSTAVASSKEMDTESWPSTSRVRSVPFAHWSARDRCDLHHVFERFNACIEQARAGTSHPVVSNVSSANPTFVVEDQADGSDESFFDAIDNVSASSHTEPKELDVEDIDDSSNETDYSDPTDPIDEARSILRWLQTLSQLQLLRLLMPSVCLEALVTLHSVDFDPRIGSRYAQSLTELVSRLHDLFSRYSDDRVRLCGYSTYEELFTLTFCEALTVLATFTSRLNCFRDLLTAHTLYVSPVVSDESISFFYDLSMSAVCGVTEWTAHSAGWIPVNRSSLSFIDFQRLCGSKKKEPTDTVTIEQYQFTSSPNSWFSRTPSLDMRYPTCETYLFRAVAGQPNSRASHLGPQRLYVELNNTAGRHNCVLFAGAFSHDTQYF